MAEHLIRCRAKLVEECYDATPTERQFEEDLPQSEDNTWDGGDPGTIVCDPCYIAIMPFTKSGQALHDEIPEAIDTYRANFVHVQTSLDLSKLRREAEGWLARVTPGCPAHNSATAALAMVAAEERRRREASRA